MENWVEKLIARLDQGRTKVSVVKLPRVPRIQREQSIPGTSEVAEDVEVFYHMSLRKLNTDFITDAKGKISTVDEARIKLNKIFNKDI